MLHTWRWNLLFSTFKTPNRDRTRSESGKRSIPRLERLEDRVCPSNLNLSRMLDNQQNETVAIDPTNPQHILVASEDWHGGYDGIGKGALFASYSRDGGITWASARIATGVGRGALPSALGHPKAAFDNFGNLFLTYSSGYVLYSGVSTGVTPTTLTDANANWVPHQWVGRKIKIEQPNLDGGDVETILDNDTTTITVQGWQALPDPA